MIKKPSSSMWRSVIGRILWIWQYDVLACDRLGIFSLHTHTYIFHNSFYSYLHSDLKSVVIALGASEYGVKDGRTRRDCKNWKWKQKKREINWCIDTIYSLHNFQFLLRWIDHSRQGLSRERLQSICASALWTSFWSSNYWCSCTSLWKVSFQFFLSFVGHFLLLLAPTFFFFFFFVLFFSFKIFSCMSL